MDFFDYQTYAVDEASNSETLLPAPASRLNLASLQSFDTHEEQFQLPDLHKTSVSNESENLHDKMDKYASASLKALPLSVIGLDLPTPSTAVQVPVDKSFQQVLSNKGTNVHTANALLSKKLSKVLNDYHSSNFQTDIQMRKSLKILQDSQEVLHLENNKLVRPDFIGSLARKSLRSDLENELLKSHLTILEDFQPIARRIKRLAKPVEDIRSIGDKILAAEEQDSNKVQEKMVEINSLRKKLEDLKIKRQLLGGIRDKFTLNQLEDNALKNSPVDEFFFEVVNKIMRVKESATYLLVLSNPTAGTVLLGQVNTYLQIANKRIYNYLIDLLYEYESSSARFGERSFTSDDTSLIFFQRSLIYLSNDLEYFNEFLKKVINMRSKKNLDEFLSQFDVDSSFKNSRPIVLSAHDPIRYLGDVLAYVHSLIVNEADFVKSLFKFQDKHIENTPKSILQENKEFLKGLDNKVLNDIFNSLANSTRIRLEQIVRFEDNAIVNFEITQLLKLYQLMFEKYGISNESSMVSNLNDLEKLANVKILTAFLASLEKVDTSGQIGTELLPPEWLSDHFNKVVELFEKYEQSGALDDKNGLLDKTFLEKVILNPVENILIKQIQSHFPFAKKNEEEKIKMLILEINCFDMIKSRLAPFHSTIFGEEYCREIYDKVISHLDTFTKQLQEVQNRHIFEKTGLFLYNNLFNMIFPVESVQDELDYDMYFSVLENPIMTLDKLESNIHENLNNYLVMALTDVQDNLLFNLSSPKIADNISQACFTNFSKFYVIFRRVLLHFYPDDQERILSILNFSEEEVNTLIGINQ